MKRLIGFQIYGGMVVVVVGTAVLIFGKFQERSDIARIFIWVGLLIGFHGIYARNRAGRKKMIDRAVSEYENDSHTNGT